MASRFAQSFANSDPVNIEVGEKEAIAAATTEPAKQSATAVDQIFSDKRSGVVTTQTADGLQMLGDAGRAYTAQHFQVPCRMDVVAKTDSTNVRLYFGDKGMVIYNWEVNKDQLWFHDPADGQEHGFPGKGAIAADQWHKFTWIVDADRSVLLVNDVERAVIPGKNNDLSLPFGVGPGPGSKIVVRRLNSVMTSENMHRRRNRRTRQKGRYWTRSSSSRYPPASPSPPSP